MTLDSILVICSLATARLAAPGPGDPARLVDLRWLARPAQGERFVVDTLADVNTRRRGAGEHVLAEVAGPGVLRHVMCAGVKRLSIVLDGKRVWSGAPFKQWPRVYPAPKPAARGRLPFAFPLVQVAGPYAHCTVPIPFSRSLRIAATGRAAAWVAGVRFAAAPPVEFSADAGSDYMQALSRVHAALVRPVSALPEMEGARTLDVQAHCDAGQSATLAELDGPAEIVGIRLRILPGAEELLRYQVIEIECDAVPTVRMPLVDFVGVSHPWPHAWFPMAGDWAAGIVHPYRRSGGRVEPAIVAYFKLPIPFARRVRITLRNRSSRLPVTFMGKLSVAAMSHGPRSVARLCGISRRLDLPAAGDARLFTAPADGALVGLSLFTTGHGRSTDWRRGSRVALVRAGKPTVQGGGLLPFALQGLSGNITFASLHWNHNSLERIARCGGARHFWADPLPLARGDQLCYVAAGKQGPRRAEVAVLWYQFDPPAPAPAGPGGVEPLPAIVHGQPGRPLPGGWRAEAETFADSAEASVGKARDETATAKDAFASGDAYLAWNASQPGDTLDLLAAMPNARYVRLWVHRLAFPSGAVFGISLHATGAGAGERTMALSDAEFRARRLGLRSSPAAVDCYGVWPHRQAYRFDMPIMLNPAPGRVGRIRFTCASKRLASRGYLLAIDQVGIDPAPATPAGWFEFESAAVTSCTAPATANLMQEGRPDFHGWGGLDVSTRGDGAVAIALMLPTAGPPVSEVEVRGIAEAGEWSARIDDAKPMALPAAKAKQKPRTWRVQIRPPRERPCTLNLRLKCAGAGDLLLDAWRPTQ